MASKASMRAYCALGCCLWFAREVWEKYGKENNELAVDALNLKHAANQAANKWEDKLTRRQAQQIQNGIKKVFDGPEDALRVGGMLLVALEDIRDHVGPAKRPAVNNTLETLGILVRKHFDTEGNEWDIYEDSLAAMERFNKMIEGL